MFEKLSLSKAFVGILGVAIKAQADQARITQDLTKMEGRSFAISIDELPQDIAICIRDGNIEDVADDAIDSVDVRVSGSLKAVINMLKSDSEGLDSYELFIMGKISTAKMFQGFLSGLSLDLQTFFEQFVSPEHASKAAVTLSQGLHVARGGIEKVSDHVKERILGHESVVKNTELQQFASEIRDLHQRLDALLGQYGKN